MLSTLTSREWLIIGLALVCPAWGMWNALSKDHEGISQNSLTWGIERKCNIRTQSVAITSERALLRKGKWTFYYPQAVKSLFAHDHADELRRASHFEYAASVEDIGFYGAPKALQCLVKQMNILGYERDKKPAYIPNFSQ